MRIEDHLRQGLKAHQAGDLAEAEALYKKALALESGNFAANRLLGAVLSQRRDYAAAEPFLRRAVALNPADPTLLQNHAVALLALKNADDALASADRALALKPDYPQALNARAVALAALDRAAEALVSYDRAVALDPAYAEGWANRGNVLRKLGHPAQAVASYDQALALQSETAWVHAERADLLWEMRRLDEALADYDHAIRLGRAGADIFYGRGHVLMMLNRLTEAADSYARTLALEPGFADAANDRGVALLGSDRIADALASFEQAIALQPQRAQFHANLGLALQKADRHGHALIAFDKAIALDPAAPYLAGGRLFTKLHLCDWRGFAQDCEDVLTHIGRGERAASPFSLLAIPSGPAVQLAAARLFTAKKYPPQPPLCLAPHPPHGKIRLAYLSSDFCEHAVGLLMADMFEHHDRRQFEIVAISTGPDDGSAVRTRLRQAFDQFIDMRHMDDAEAARRIHALKADILIDLNGHTGGSRAGIAARRPAPLQVNFMGYAGTMGADYIDYLIADQVALPEHLHPFFAEKIVSLPVSFQINTPRTLAAQTPTRAECGLPEAGFVFCSFNNVFKITPDVFDVWMRLLHAVPGSVLWQKAVDDETRANLLREAQSRGVPAERLIFAPHTARVEDHLARQSLGDLFLDTLYYNAHATAADALWCGLPVLTCAGDSFAARIAASLLEAIGLPEMITHSLADYEFLALALATDPARLTGMKQRLARNRDTTALFDVRAATQNVERAYRKMWERQQAGLPPNAFAI